MNAQQQRWRPSIRPGLVVATLALSVALGVGLAQLEKVTSAITLWLDVGICASPLLFALLTAYALVERPKLHFLFCMLFYAIVALAPLFMRPTSARVFVLAGALWSLAAAACALGNRRTGAVGVVMLGCLVSGLHVSRLL